MKQVIKHYHWYSKTPIYQAFWHGGSKRHGKLKHSLHQITHKVCYLGKYFTLGISRDLVNRGTVNRGLLYLNGILKQNMYDWTKKRDYDSSCSTFQNTYHTNMKGMLSEMLNHVEDVVDHGVGQLVF